ncbi:MAG TPA: MFS transporter [Kofleriaceae bacterium]
MGVHRRIPRDRDVALGETIRSDIPPRLDALGWSTWHRRMVIALGITWVLDGLEASLVSNLGPILERPETLHMSAADVGLTNSAYLVGQVVGAIGFGYLTDRLGRKKLFFATLLLYLIATALSGLSPGFWTFLVFRFFAGGGIGGEYSAINSAIDELVPARVRGRVDLAINGTYWLGAAAAAGLTLVLLDPHIISVSLGWRLAFGSGAILGLIVVVMRRDVPESPRWLIMHGYTKEAETVTAEIERHAGAQRAQVEPVAVKVHGPTNLAYLARTLFVRFRKRTILGLSLMLAQAFLYNAIFFSNAQILTHYHHVDAKHVGLYMLPFAAGNFLGPLVLGHWFDHWGRRVMIPITYAASGVLLLATGALFWAGYLDAMTQTIAWSVVFFVASAAASSAYLTVSELFPVELRGMAIALFYAFGTLVGAIAPSLFGAIIDTGSAANLFYGYALASALMIGAAVIARIYGVNAEGRSLESLSAEES